MNIKIDYKNKLHSIGKDSTTIQHIEDAIKSRYPKEFKNDKHYTKDTFINEVVCKTGSIDYRNFDCLIEIINVIHNLNLYKNISSFKLGKK